ncbi:hypothetical protein BGZ60DRAFT_541313 [Tricladium varicosporioides]|nr:hypothetical protein BGZ60DRAFT_541313 [Hymenoscyphus varicosporioides]
MKMTASTPTTCPPPGPLFLSTSHPIRPLPSVLSPLPSSQPLTLTRAIEYIKSQLSLHKNSPNYPSKQRTVTAVHYNQVGAPIPAPPSLSSPQKSTPSSLDDFVLDKSWDLKKFIEHIQVILDTKTHNQPGGASQPLLVKSVEIRTGDEQGFLKTFPPVAGVLAGGGIFVSSAEREAEYVVWGDERGELVRYWECYRDMLMKGIMVTMGKPIMKVRTVARVGNLPVNHVFRDMKQIEDGKESVSDDDENEYHEEHEVKVEDFVVNGIEQLRQRLADMPALNFDSPEFQVTGAYHSAWNHEKNIPGMDLQEIYAGWLQSGREPMKEMKFRARASGGYDRQAPHHPIHNWGTYQRMGGERRWHQEFPLDHVPFPPMGAEIWVAPGSDEEPCYYPGYLPADQITRNYPHPLEIAKGESIAKFQAMSSQLQELLIEGKESAAGFDEKDDNAFLPEELMSKIKLPENPHRSTKSRATLSLRNYALDQPATYAPSPAFNHSSVTLSLKTDGLMEHLIPTFSNLSHTSSPNTSKSATPSTTPKLASSLAKPPILNNQQFSVLQPGSALASRPLIYRKRSRSPLKQSTGSISQLRPDSPAFNFTRKDDPRHHSNLLRLLATRDSAIARNGMSGANASPTALGYQVGAPTPKHSQVTHTLDMPAGTLGGNNSSVYGSLYSSLNSMASGTPQVPSPYGMMHNPNTTSPYTTTATQNPASYLAHMYSNQSPVFGNRTSRFAQYQSSPSLSGPGITGGLEDMNGRIGSGTGSTFNPGQGFNFDFGASTTEFNFGGNGSGNSFASGL